MTISDFMEMALDDDFTEIIVDDLMNEKILFDGMYMNMPSELEDIEVDSWNLENGKICLNVWEVEMEG